MLLLCLGQKKITNPIMNFSFFKKNKALIFKIENYSVNLVILGKNGPSFDLIGAYFEPLSLPAFDKEGKLNDSRNIWAIVFKILKKAGLVPETQDIKQEISTLGAYSIGIVVSDSYVYSGNFEISSVPGKKIEDELLSYCVSNFPITREDMIFEYRLDDVNKKDAPKDAVLNKKTGQVLAIDNRYVVSLRSIFADNGIIADNIISDSVAYSSLYYIGKQHKEDDILSIVDLSFNDTSISFYKGGRLIYSRSINFGLRDIEEAVSVDITDKTINIRNLILANGLKDIQKKETHLIVKAIESYLGHIRETLDFMLNTKDIKCDNIVLSGFGAFIPGMVEYISINISKKISPLISPIWLKDDSGSAGRVLYAGMIGAGIALLSDPSTLATPILNVAKFYRLDNGNGFLGKFQYFAGLHLSSEKKTQKSLFSASNEQAKTVEQIIEGDQKPIDIKSYKKLLVIIAVSGAVLVTAVFFVRIALNSLSPKKVLVTEVRQFPYNKEIPIELPVAVEPLQFTPDRVRGRIIQVKVAREADYLSTQKKALADATALLLAGEKIWDIPVLSAQATENPARFSFAVFNANEAISLAETYVKSRITTADYQLGEAQFIDIQTTDNNSIYLLKMLINVGSGQILDDLSNAPSAPEAKLEQTSSPSQPFEENIIDDTASASKKIQDKATFRQYRIRGDGSSVNLRSAASANSFLITQLNDGEIVDYVSDKDGWTKIITKEGDEGWIKSELLINDLR